MELVYFLGAAILGLGIAYGAVQYLTRNRANDRTTEAVTKAEYDNFPDKAQPYDERTREQLERNVRP